MEVHIRQQWAPVYQRMTLGSGLVDQSQKITAAAMQSADIKVWAQPS